MQKRDFETYQKRLCEISGSCQNFPRPTFFEVPFTTPTMLIILSQKGYFLVHYPSRGRWGHQGMNPKLIKSRVMSNTYTVHFPLFFVVGFFLRK